MIRRPKPSPHPRPVAAQWPQCLGPAGVTPRVFLSYSHDSEAHKAWVLQLAERLRYGGVEVTLDQWQVRFGEDVVRFMDQGIREADRVLMVCTANYVATAEERKGGAGYEGMIVTGHVARATDTIKFVPIVRDNPAEPLIPAFLGQRVWLDFRDDGLFEQRLEGLLRQLHGVPLPQPNLELQQDQQQSIRWCARWRFWREPLAEGVELLMAWIPADPGGQQREYLLASEPISLRQWQVVAGWPAEGEELNPDPSEHHLPDQPVTGINHQQALEFCRRLATHSGRYFELPSHEQWEHACRAGSPSAYSWGDAWSESLATDTANPWGLRQLHGGLWEWCQEGGLRGGSWQDPVERRQCGSRAEASDPLHPSTVGLRVCCLPLGTPPQQLKASRRQWRPPVLRSACDDVLGLSLSEAQFSDLQRGLRRFRIVTAPQLRLFLSLLADRQGAGATDPHHPLRSDEATTAEAFAEALADPAVAEGGPGWREPYPYSLAAFLWRRDGWRQRAERAVGPEAFWAELALGGAGRQQAFAAAYQRAQLHFGEPR